MKALQRSGKRFIGGILLCGCLALPAARPVAARVGLGPRISASVESGGIVQVTGWGFTPGGSVLVQATNSTSGRIVARAATRASSIKPPPPPPCTPKPTCYYVVFPGIGVIVIHLSLRQWYCAEPITVRAIDLTTHVRGNLVRMTLPSCASAPRSTFFATATEESYSTYQLPGDGDLWPSCWADDDNVYAANGDGTAFTGSGSRFDMAVSRITGMPPHLGGATLATNVGTNWSGPNYNRKPTGMLCVNNTLYLAFQNLNRHTFNDAPAASIAKSTDHGVTWTWDASAPMFGDPGNPSDPGAYKFTTIFFLDYGKNNANAGDNYAYAYGFDNNWHGQQKLYLARIPNTSIQQRSSWQFFRGTDGSGNPLWSRDITAKVPVLEDDRLLYPRTFGGFCCPNGTVLAQGGVVYDAPLRRYIFTSWSFATHEFYDAPHPWGPWSLFLSKDFGPFQLPRNRGRYGTSIPSKYISQDGKTLYVQSNVCCRGDSYTFSLRKLYVRPYAPGAPTNAKDATNNLARTGSGTTAISKSTHFGRLCGPDCSDLLNNGVATESEDDLDQQVKSLDWWGYTWNQPYNVNKVVYTTGTMFSNGGWYGKGLHVQVRRHFTWVDVSGLSVTPAYPYSRAAGTNQTYTFTFNDTWGDGVRIVGTPGGSGHFTSIAELAVYYG
jgi:Domain of unknown function (DUF4185)